MMQRRICSPGVGIVTDGSTQNEIGCSQVDTASSELRSSDDHLPLLASRVLLFDPVIGFTQAFLKSCIRLISDMSFSQP